MNRHAENLREHAETLASVGYVDTPMAIRAGADEIDRLEKRIAELEALVNDFLYELDVKLKALNAIGDSTKESGKSPLVHHADPQTSAPIF